jgi:hypothetical protein
VKLRDLAWLFAELRPLPLASAAHRCTGQRAPPDLAPAQTRERVAAAAAVLAAALADIAKKNARVTAGVNQFIHKELS